MESALERTPRGARAAVIRLRSLGDCILTTPALAILREYRPDLAVAVVVEDRFRPVFEGNSDVDQLLPPSVRELRRWRPHLCLNLHGGNRSLRLTLLSGAGLRAGFGHYRGRCAYNVRIPTAQQVLGVARTTHTAEQLASAMFHLGVPQREIPPARLFAERREASRPYAVLHATAAGPPGKTWPAEGFLAVARRLARTHGLEPVFIGAADDDLSAFSSFRRVAGAPLAEVKSLVAGASIFVGNDSGPAHMAAAFGVPVAVIFGRSDPAVWGPWKTVSEVVAARGPIESVSVEEVEAAVDRLRTGT
ncbi:MAG: glycosyltransferase family 9 protein [Bryobacterales bacterium]|nr:glycosyltransferase family 9 protein [Bryobacterales bacterium]